MEKLFKLQKLKQSINHSITLEKKQLHRDFIKVNKTLVRVCDILLILAILFNIGAIVLTNMLVMKVEPTTVIVEANPVQAKNLGIEAHPGGYAELAKLIIPFLYWTVVVLLFLFWRRVMYSDAILNLLLVWGVYLALLTALDFFNNLGFLLGKSMFGG